jgi:hypothetical protein
MAFELLVLGALALWPGLRVFVQARLASLGEGSAAAAGIGALMVSGRDSAELLDLGQATFRSVRIDRLLPDHLRVEPATNSRNSGAFLLSTPAPFGSIDVRRARAPSARRDARGAARRGDARESARSWGGRWRRAASPPLSRSRAHRAASCASPRLACVPVASRRVASRRVAWCCAVLGCVALRQAFVSHSWRDDPLEKYRLLQEWRARFLKTHGREPTMCAPRRVAAPRGKLDRSRARASREPTACPTPAVCTRARPCRAPAIPPSPTQLAGRLLPGHEQPDDRVARAVPARLLRGLQHAPRAARPHLPLATGMRRRARALACSSRCTAPPSSRDWHAPPRARARVRARTRPTAWSAR